MSGDQDCIAVEINLAPTSSNDLVEARDVEQFKAELDEAWKDIQFLHTAL